MINKYKSIKYASIVGIIGNLFLAVIKLIIGLITKSKAMMADAINSVCDIFSSLMTFIGNKIASIPRDEDHNLGHGKAEYIYSMMISIVMAIMAIIILKDSILNIINKETIIYSNWLIVVCIITILTKLILFIYTNNLAKKHKNILLKANSKDHLNDTLLTTINLISCILTKNNIYIFDSLAGIIISIWIIITAVKIYKESYNVLMDKALPIEIQNKVIDIIKQHQEIKKINHFNSTPIGYKYQISFTIFLDGNMTTFKSHEIADNLEKEIDKKIEEIDLTIIHVNPI